MHRASPPRSSAFVALALTAMCCAPPSVTAGPPREREIRLHVGELPAGPHDAITDVAGIRVGHVTLVQGESVRTGVTAIVPHDGDPFREKVPAAIVVANGFGKLVGSTQVEELGQIETPILLTNTLQVWDAAAAIVDWALRQPGNEGVRSINPVVGETNDGWLNDIRARSLTREHFTRAIEDAKTGPVAQGSVGAGTGTMAFGYKAGIGTASRRVDAYTVGVLVQANFGGTLTIDGARIGSAPKPEGRADGSCMIVIATDAPLDARQLRRLARRAFAGMARTGASFAHGSGDYAIAFSTAESMRADAAPDRRGRTLDDAALSPLFVAVADATEQSIVHALVHAEPMRGTEGHAAPALDKTTLRKALDRR